MSMEDNEIWNEAFRRLPLPRLMTLIGDGRFTNPKTDCPFCEAKGGKFKVFLHNSRWFFKCHKPGCPGNDREGHNEIDYLEIRRNCSHADAASEYLKLAVPELLAEQEAQRKTAPSVPKPASLPAGESQSRNVWHHLWKKLALNAADREVIKTKRGLSDATIDRLGFRSNNPANQMLVESLQDDYSAEFLVSVGIFKQDRKRGLRPNPQLLGFGITGKKDPKTREPIWGNTEPHLIPYLDADGIPFALRPHKGGIKRPDDDESDENCSSHFYCPFLVADLTSNFNGTLVVTEGEWKAAALYQCGIPAICVPGITFIRNPLFKTELLSFLREYNVSEVVIIFDNEIKDDPNFSNYKPDPWDRYDTQVYAEYTAIDLRNSYGCTCKVGHLPDEFRVQGKADFDGILAHLVEKHGLTEGTRRATKRFEECIENATERRDNELFPDAGRRIIECKLKRLFHVPLLLSGGDRELRASRRFNQPDPETQNHAIDSDLARAFRGVLGCYYIRKPLEKEHKQAISKQIDELNDQLNALQDQNGEVKKIRSLKTRISAKYERLKGLPEAISDFILTCEYKLHTPDGKVERLVRLRNKADSGPINRKLIRISGADMARHAEFLRWCYDTGKASFRGGARELQKMVEDMDHHSYLRDIIEVNYYGFHRESGLWFFGDCAFDKEGKRIEADDNRIYWDSSGIGYQIDSSDDSSFQQRTPLMLAPAAGKPSEVSLESLFTNAAEDLYACIGDYDAWMALGIMSVYGAAPEILKQYGGQPGLWLSGKMSSGKTTIARGLMPFWGFPNDLGGVSVGQRTTHVGMSRFLAQYSCLPAWFDEYRASEIDPQKNEVIRGAFDRNSGAKGQADSSNKTKSARILTTPLITGESSPADSATRSRYTHSTIAITRRQRNSEKNFVRFQQENKHWYLFGRWIMEHRPQFVEGLMETLEAWMNDEEVKTRIVNERVRFVHGAAYAGFIVLAKYLAPKLANLHQEFTFRGFLMSHGDQALQDVVEEQYLSKFWNDVIGAMQRGKVFKKFFQIRAVEMAVDGSLKESADPTSPQVCYVAFNAVYGQYEADIRSRGGTPPLDLNDIKREMSKEDYWVPYPKKKNGSNCHRIVVDGHKISCWVLSLDKRTDSEPGDEDPYLFPFASELLAQLSDEDEPPHY